MPSSFPAILRMISTYLEMSTATEVQRAPGKSLRRRTPVVITWNGRPMQIMLPVPKDPKTAQAFATFIEDCLEDWEMEQNREVLTKRWNASLTSGPSDLKI